MKYSWVTFALIGAVLVGATAGTVLVVREPNFWLGFIYVIVTAAMPYITKRMKPEDEAAWRGATRQADGGDEWRRKRLGLPTKG